MRILIFGGQGMLGSAICRQLKKVHRIVGAPPRAILDITHSASTMEFIRDFKPDIMINCAAVHDATVCTENPELAKAVNITAVATLAEMAEMMKIKFFHFSTDQVLKAPPLQHSETAFTYHYDVYSHSKQMGETVLLESDTILRVSALYGHDPCRGKNRPNFVEQIIQVVDDRKQTKLPSNIGCSPGYVEDIAKVLARWTRGDYKSIPHIVHLAPTDLSYYSWCTFGQDIVTSYGRMKQGFRHIKRDHRAGPSTGLANLHTIYNWALPSVRSSLRSYLNMREKGSKV